jgi:hypothetical protein
MTNAFGQVPLTSKPGTTFAGVASEAGPESQPNCNQISHFMSVRRIKGIHRRGNIFWLKRGSAHLQISLNTWNECPRAVDWNRRSNMAAVISEPSRPCFAGNDGRRPKTQGCLRVATGGGPSGIGYKHLRRLVADRANPGIALGVQRFGPPCFGDVDITRSGYGFKGSRRL